MTRTAHARGEPACAERAHDPRLARTEAVRAAAAGVPDPEMPPVTIGQLGMIIDAAVDGSTARIEVMPTFSFCPAIAYIEADIRSAVAAVEGIDTVEVVWRRDLAWDPEMISADGRRALTAAGMAPPGSGQSTNLLQIGGVRCPYCGSRNTRVDSPFGSAPCRSTHSCRDCKTPFDAIKAL